MSITSRLSRVFAATTACAAICLASQSHAQCIGYNVAAGPATFVAGVDDTGNHCDDCTTAITLPFGFSFYGNVFNTANVLSNGALEFVNTDAQFGNVCLPVIGFGPTIFPFWDDQRTDLTPDSGIFTTTVGSSPNRTFVIEWRTHYYADAATTFINDYEILLYENGTNFDVVYGTPMSDRSSATIGSQAADIGPSTQFVCNTAGPVSGTSLRFSCVGSATAGACCVATTAVCTFTDATGCASQTGVFHGVGTTCAATNCPVAGACCASAGACTLTFSTSCAAPNTYVGDASTCTPTNACAGACCTASNGGCAVSTTAGCAAGSTFQSIGTTCIPNPCPQPPSGACCIASSQTCTDGFASTCATAGGAYQGDSTTCATSSCPFGACCAGCNGCFISTSGACTGQQGTYHGDGSTCDTLGCNIINGGFESGAFGPGWTQFGDISATGVYGPGASPGTGLLPHGGGRAADFGPVTSTGGIQQTIPAHAGDTVTIGFWYAAAGTLNSFDCTFDGVSLVSFVNDTSHTVWTQFTFPGIVVSADNPVLMFTFTNPPSWDDLDDVTVCIASSTSGACCNNTSGACSSTTAATCASGSTFQGLGTACAPNPCPQPPAGVCCRGSTCNTTVASAAACTGSLIAGQLAGAAFPASANCNLTGNSTGPCCYANYNKVNGITVQDIFDFLNDWFAGSRYANFGSNGNPATLAVQNIFDFLNAWFAGGCS